ncbi:MAG: Smr/MutS family protein [Polyangiaceae bacterium]
MEPLRVDPCPPKTRADLEWDRILGAIGQRCSSALGRELAIRLPFAETRAEARQCLSQSVEAKRLLDEGRPLPVAEVEDVRAAVERTRIGGVLAPSELRGVGRLLQTARGLRRFLSSRRAELPALFGACSTDPMLDDVADELARCFEPDGTLADRASPNLRELRGQWHAARQRMLSRMEELMRRYEGILQDGFVTEREGRWVLPVRSDAHERFPGIVHATSSSGSTLFVEPRAVVPMGNRLKVLESEVKREEDAVYARLTALLADVLPSVEAARDAVALADVRAATARLAEDLDLSFPDVTDEPRLDLRDNRHPLLLLDALRVKDEEKRPDPVFGRVVPSDVSIAASQAVIVSGPNAGGKTVALKSIGLAALMVRCGLPIPCAGGSIVGLFDIVLTDVGDDQSLHKNLSTFSAHVSNLAAILQEATPASLVLLDELAGGTDPREGEALAAGVLDSLCARGAAVVATTHYEGLKALALVDQRFRNACVGFDLATMTPTFKLVMGLPGSSSALAVARRFGLPATVIERAERFLAREDRHFEGIVKKLHDERAALELARAAAEDREREAAEMKTELEAELLLARNRERRALSDEARELMDRLKRARTDLREAQARLRSKKAEPQALRDAATALDRVAGEVAIGGAIEPLLLDSAEAERPPVQSASLRRGARVWVQRLRGEAEVVDVLPGGGSVRVAAGAIKLTVPTSELRAAGADPSSGRPTVRSSAPISAPSAEVLVQMDDNTCDLRGLRVDDGLALAMSFLDRALNEGQNAVFLLHGQGTGALRDALRRELARSPYVARFQGAPAARGGEAVTIVWLG